LFKIENIGTGQEVDILVLNKGGNMNKTENIKNQKAIVVIIKDFGIDVSQDLSTANLILLKIFVFLQVISLFLVFVLMNNDYTYLTNEGHLLLEDILYWITNLGFATLIWSWCIKIIRKLISAKPNDRVIRV